MKRRSLWLVSIVIASLTFVAIAGETVERPYEHHSTQILMYDPSNGTWEIESQVGQATHMGLFTSWGTGGEAGGSGYATAANGDKLYWEVTGSIITFTGGTGRFEDASGSFTETVISEVWEVHPEFPWLWRRTASLSGIGTITY
jgi:hypothetical protein